MCKIAFELALICWLGENEKSDAYVCLNESFQSPIGLAMQMQIIFRLKVHRARLRSYGNQLRTGKLPRTQ